MTKIRKKDLHFTLMQLRTRTNEAFVRGNDNRQEIANILRTLKLHGEAHMAQDLTPQFRELCKKVDTEIAGNGKQMSRHILDHRENSTLFDKQVSGLRDRMDVLESQGAHTCHNHAALQEDRKRIIELEIRLQDLETANSGLWEHGTEQDAGILVMLKALPEIEILKTQVAGIQQDNTRSYAVHHKEAFDAVYAKMKEQRSDYHGHIRQLVEENAAAHIQQSDTIVHMQEQIKGLENRLSRAQDMIAECHPDGYVGMPPIKGEGKKTCTNCIYGDGAYCNHKTPSHCSHYELWVSKTPLPLKGKPATRKAGKKVQ